MIRRLSIAALLLAGGCAAPYTLVSPSQVAVAGNAMRVTPSAAWNKAPASPLAIQYEEDWTQNGPALDALMFIGGLPDGQALARQRRKQVQQVPVFRAAMTPPELTSMIESYYRLREGAKLFRTDGIAPATLFGKPALRFDYSYVGVDDVRRRGRSVAAIVGGKLYLLSLEGAASHYFEAAAPQFDSIVASASLG
jgi:hypothetical protein